MQTSKNECKTSETIKSDPDFDSCDPIPTWFVAAVSAFFVSWIAMVGAFIARRFF